MTRLKVGPDRLASATPRPILGCVAVWLPQSTLRRDAFPASPVNARLSGAPRLRIAFAMLSLSRRLQIALFIGSEKFIYILILRLVLLVTSCIASSIVACDSDPDLKKEELFSLKTSFFVKAIFFSYNNEFKYRSVQL
jgi:hypothetical protein